MKTLAWQSEQWKALTERVQQNKIAHAMLFHGPDGVGKMPFVANLVARIFCQQPVDNVACGLCESCHLLKVGTHPDLRTIECEEDKKNISVDQIRDLIEYLNLTPHSGKYKIAVVKQAEKMTVNAANSLLKTLEEPPRSALIILTTHRPEQLLPTILSRCQKTLFNLPAKDMADQWLAGQVQDSERRRALLALANGSPFKALEYEQQGAIEQRTLQFETLLALLEGKQDPVTAAESWLKLDMDLSLYSMVSWIIDMARLKTSDNAALITNSDLQTRLMQLNQRTSLPEILKYHEFLNECLIWSKSNINSQLLLEDLLIRWVKLFR